MSLRVDNRSDMGLVTCVTAIVHVDASISSVSARTMVHPPFANLVHRSIGTW